MTDEEIEEMKRGNERTRRRGDDGGMTDVCLDHDNKFQKIKP
jgi:hypothetical protein